MMQMVFLIGGFVFAVALLPTVVGASKPAWGTSALTSAILAAYTVAFAFMGQWWSALGSAMTTALWCVLLVQEITRRRPK